MSLHRGGGTSLGDPPGEHIRLVELEAAVLADVEVYGRCSLADKPRVAKLSAVIQDRLGRIRALTRDLELVAEEADGEEEEQRALAALLAQHKAEYARIQAAFKQAALDQRATALRSAAEERRELLAGGEAGLRQRRAQTEADAAALAEDVTGGLRRTRQVLAEELEHTSATLAAMEASHAQLGKTRDEYHGQHRHLRKSKGLLGTLDWQAKSERYMLWFGLTLFLAVCAYIFQKRAGHFVPNALKPTTLLAGRHPVPAPATLRHPAAMPLHTAGGAHRQPPAKAHQPPPHLPRHQQRQPPASPAPATQPQGDVQMGGSNDAVWPSSAPDPGMEQQQELQQQLQQPQQPGQGAPLSPPPPPLNQAPQEQEPQQPVQQQQQPAEQQPRQAVEQRQQPDLLEPIAAEPVGQLQEQAAGDAQPQEQAGVEAQPQEQAGVEAQPQEQAAGEAQPQQQAEAEAQQMVRDGGIEAPHAAAEQPAPEQQTAEEQQPPPEQPVGSGSAADAEGQHSPAVAEQQDDSEAELAAASQAASATLAAQAAAAGQAAADAVAAAGHDEEAGGAAAAAAAAVEGDSQAAGGDPLAVGPEGAPEPERHVILDRQGRRIAVDATAEFVRSPLGEQPAGEAAGEETPRDEL